MKKVLLTVALLTSAVVFANEEAIEAVVAEVVADVVQIQEDTAWLSAELKAAYDALETAEARVAFLEAERAKVAQVVAELTETAAN